MKTEGINSGDPIWTQNVELLPQEVGAVCCRISYIIIDDTSESTDKHQTPNELNTSKPFFENIVQLPEMVTVANLDPSESSRCPFTNCKIKFPDSAKLNYHISCHSEGAFACFQCGEPFSTWKPLISHMWRLHKLDLGLYSCDKCDYKTYSLAKLNNVHKYIHGDAKNFSCDVCKKAFKNSEKPFSCNVCSYTTSDHNSLRRHNLRHTGQKPYKCSYCSYACIQSSTYKTHLKTKHPGLEKDLLFTCVECQFRSVNKDMYITHMVTAHNLKPQDCT
ncbi:unnamed protein product [Diabrotica balteata]|uniref:C2H2-type domain-containing protein n=1 Tax=Diabrotica balteata TaxID=107213 RepID=A0A9N9SXJ4_DIABA|nr:unnamed protein product [Diabrotica balteata]